MKSVGNILILLLIFLSSVYVRIGYLNNDIRYNNCAHIITLATLKIWNDKGFKEYYFSPVQTWNNKGDKFIANYKRLEDKEGNNYFVSYPPFTFLLAYFIGNLTGGGFSQSFLQILSLCLHFTGALLVYFIMLTYYGQSCRKLFLPGVFSFIVFCFFSPLLFHGINYFSEMLVIPLLLSGILVVLKICNKEIIPKIMYVLLGVIVFLSVYSEWTGLFFAFTICVIYSFNIIRDKKNLLIARVALFSSLFALALVIFQYSRINGMPELFHGWKIRFIERSGIFGEAYSDKGLSYLNINSYKRFLELFNTSFMGIGYAAVLFLLLTMFLIRKNIYKNLTDKSRIIILLPAVPVAVHFLLFFNSGVIHFGEWAKIGIPLSLATGIAVKKLTEFIPVRYKNLTIVAMSVLIICGAALSVKSVNNYYSKWKDLSYLKNVSHFIKNNINTDEVIFVTGNEDVKNNVEYLSFITERNIMYVKNKSEAEKIILEKNKDKGIIFEVESSGLMQNVFTEKQVLQLGQ